MLETVDSALSVRGLATFMGLGVGPWVKERAQDRFASEGDDASGKWAPLKDTTVEIRENGPWGVEGAHPINKRTGELEAYITQSSFGITSIPGAAALTYPDKPPKSPAIKQKLSTAQKGRKSPSTIARPVLALGERDLAQVMTMLAFHVQGVGVTRGARSK